MDDGKNFTGLVGDLFNGYSDIGWANLFFSLERSQFIDYTDPYMLDHGGFMVNNMEIQSSSVNMTPNDMTYETHSLVEKLSNSSQF